MLPSGEGSMFLFQNLVKASCVSSKYSTECQPAIDSTVVQQPLPSSFTSASPSSLDRSHAHTHCSTAFLQFSGFREHTASFHGEELQAVCPDSSSSESGDDRNIGVKTDEAWQHVCNVCSMAFTEVRKLKEHEKIHTGHKPYICGICNHVFTQVSHLKSHQMIHTGHKPYVCDVCSCAFTEISHLKTHKMIHTGHKPFVCNVCGKAFNVASTLNVHERIHTGDKPLVCDVCSKVLTCAGKLNAHKKIHIGYKPLVCEVCNKAFTAPAQLKVHKRIYTG